MEEVVPNTWNSSSMDFCHITVPTHEVVRLTVDAKEDAHVGKLSRRHVFVLTAVEVQDHSISL